MLGDRWTLLVIRDLMVRGKQTFKEFRDLAKVHFVGAYPDYAHAFAAWKTKAQATVDNALMRYFIIHAHRLLDPDADGRDHEH